MTKYQRRQNEMLGQDEALRRGARVLGRLRPCVGIALFNSKGQVWAGRRFKKSAALRQLEAEGKEANGQADNEAGLWQLPQGGIEAGEKPLAAAKRELWEETGIKEAAFLAEAPRWLSYTLPPALLAAKRGGRPFGGSYRGQKQKWFAFLYQGDESEIAINPPPKADEIEFDAWGWRELEDIAAHIIFFKREVYRQMAAEFAPIAAKLRAEAERSAG